MMSKRATNKTSNTTTATVPGYQYIRSCAGLYEYQLKSNGLTVLYQELPGTGVITTNLTYRVGARDEARGETGLAHMLEHMLFKPTKRDLEAGIDSGAMQFERETGCILNANTWKDRTTYYFNYPAEHFARALSIEADRMQNVVITDKEFLPERGNVLSEFDMYFGDPQFALTVSMVSSAFQAHPYGHETIGTREDIEDYTVEKLELFYRGFYRPDNATLMVIGDVPLATALQEVKRSFGAITNPDTPIPRITSREPLQEGRREITVSRPSNSNLLAIGIKHDGFPSVGWHETLLALGVLAEGPESILHKLLVDTGKATALETLLEPTYDPNLAIIYVTLAKAGSHASTERLILDTIRQLTTSTIRPLVKKELAHQITSASFNRASSLSIASELTEYVASGDWTAYASALETLHSITPKAVHTRIQQLFTTNRLTIGNFIGTN